MEKCGLCGDDLAPYGEDPQLTPFWDCGGDCLKCVTQIGRDPDEVEIMYEYYVNNAPIVDPRKEPK